MFVQFRSSFSNLISFKSIKVLTSIAAVLVLRLPVAGAQVVSQDSTHSLDSATVMKSLSDTTLRVADTLSSMPDTNLVGGNDTTSTKRDTVAARKDTLNIITSEAGANTVPGFRVQVSSTQNLLEAISTESLADSLLPNYNVYIVYDAPYYKVRVGDFRSRYDADRAITYVISHGFPDAWPVPDNVFRNPKDRKQ